MKGYIGNTDHKWFDHLRTLAMANRGAVGVLDEVNFWKPSARAFRALEPGAPFFFRLKAPRRRIGGFGIFTRYTELPDWLAWECFGQANGAATEGDFVALLDRYRAKQKGPATASQGLRMVGCILISQACFLPDDCQIREPEGWSPSIVQGKGLDLTRGEGLRIWSEVSELAGARRLAPAAPQTIAPPFAAGDEIRRYGAPQLVTPRLGQGTFRVAVMEAYERACAVTTEHSLPVLEAAHIRPYHREGEHTTSNGLFLRRDLHTLFDLGYLTVDDSHRMSLGSRLRADYGNGRAYEELHGQPIFVPKNVRDRPAPELIRWHQENVFRG